MTLLGCSKTPSPSQPSNVAATVEPDQVISGAHSESVTIAALPLPRGLVGTQSCAGCHPKQYASYLTTAHSRSLQRADDVKLDLVGTLTHPLSEIAYDVLQSNHRVIHREWKYFVDPTSAAQATPLSFSGEEPRMLVAELPVSYVMGSGSFAKGYLLSDPPYLIQSPVTWYRGPAAFGMAPGYDVKLHSGMTRVISDECLFCHAGSVTQRFGNSEQVDIPETAIGCERCHGPGLAHATKFKVRLDQTTSTETTGDDTAIVHPGKLSRSLAEAVCAQCHLQGDIVVQAEGKSIWDFKAGEPLSDTRVAYKIDRPSGDEKTFVDHFDQLWQSQCYLKSDSLTCITCHDPHHANSNESAAVYQQANCLKCHDDQACGLELTERHRQHANQCVLCHMPKSASEVPHAATTHHQISIPLAEPINSTRPQAVTLRKLQSPLDEAAQLTSQRTELLASAFWVLDTGGQDQIPAAVVAKTRDELIQWAKIQPPDPVVFTIIARLALQQAEGGPNIDNDHRSRIQYWQLAGQFAQAALAIKSIPSASRKAALEVMASKQYDEGNFQAAAQSYYELTRIRRSALDWYNLGICYGRLKQFPEAESSLREAIRLNATYAAPYRSLAILYSSINPPLAEQMRQTHELLLLRDAAP